MLFGGIKKYFNDLQKARAEKKAVQHKLAVAIPQAINNGDAAQVRSLCDEVGGASSSFRHFMYFVKLALNNDNLDVFNVLFSNVKDKNWIDELILTGPGMPFFYAHEHVLHAAISAQAKTIALALARDPNIDVQGVGYTGSSRYVSGGLLSSGHSVRVNTPHEAPIDLAHRMGMSDVEVVIAQRIADAYTQKAAAARQALAPKA